MSCMESLFFLCFSDIQRAIPDVRSVFLSISQTQVIQSHMFDVAFIPLMQKVTKNKLLSIENECQAKFLVWLLSHQEFSSFPSPFFHARLYYYFRFVKGGNCLIFEDVRPLGKTRYFLPPLTVALSPPYFKDDHLYRKEQEVFFPTYEGKIYFQGDRTDRLQNERFESAVRKRKEEENRSICRKSKKFILACSVKTYFFLLRCLGANLE